MVKKIVIGALVFVLVASVGLFFWARAVFTQDAVRTTLANQLSQSLGQPVTVGNIGAAIYPRVTVNLGEVTIGQPPRIQVRTLHVGTDFRALLSRRIEHASLRLAGARVELPLPEFALASSTEPGSGEPAAASPVEIVSIDEIVLNDVEIKSGSRTLRGDIEMIPQGNGVTLKKVRLVAEESTIDVTGQITDVAGPVGELTVKAGALNFDRLLAFVSDFAGNAGLGAPEAGRAPKTHASTAGKAPAMNVVLLLDADRATMGTLALEKLSGRARVTSDAMTLEPVSFGIFGGKYDGSLRFSLGSSPNFRLNATLSGVDMAAATKFAGSPDTITGRLSGKLSLSGRGIDAVSALNSARGTARVDITKGTVKNLGLVRTIVTSTSGRSSAPAKSATGPRDESFERLGATLAVANGSANTQDLRFESPDLLLAATGGLRLDGSAINLAGQVQLSDELTQQAGRDLVRYTQEQGRVTLPATITGSADNPQVRIDMSKVATRAITNKATAEAEKVIKRNLDGFFKR
ncbi:MAG: AsmA family protein [Vicinamibacterales bacterium]